MQYTKADNYLKLGGEGWDLSFVNQQQQERLYRFAQMEKAFKQNEQISGLMDYKINKQEIKDIAEADCIEDQDALELMRVVIGGYVDDDFATHLSYNDFQQKKEDFGVLKNVYQSVHKKYRNKKIQESKIKFRSILLMVYLQQNISKLSRFRIQEIFSRNKIVW